MARGFGTTFGVDDADAINTTYTGWTNTRSVWAWIYKHGNGGGTFGRVMVQQDGTASSWEIDNSPDTGLYFQVTFNGGLGTWESDDPLTLDTWLGFGLKYDAGATTNDPTYYIGGTKLTVGAGVTETLAPSGTINNITGNVVTIGNRLTTPTRAWDGMLAEVAIWNALLDDNEFAALANGYSPALIRPQSLVEYIPMVRANVSRKNAAPTISQAAVQPHPRIIMPGGPFTTSKVTAAPPAITDLMAQIVT